MHSLLWDLISITALLNIRPRKLFAIIMNRFGCAVDLQGDRELRRNEKGEKNNKGMSPELRAKYSSLALLGRGS